MSTENKVVTGPLGTYTVENKVEPKQKLVLYVDGGCRPNPGFGGWGMHGYLHNETLNGKKATKGHIPTSEGYVDGNFIKNVEAVKEISPIQYVDGYGSFDTDVTNNIAELVATTNALKYADNYNLSSVNVYSDSEYVCKGLELRVDMWKKNNWLKRDMTPPVNVEYWKKLVDARDTLKNKNVDISVSWVKAHSDKILDMPDILGNIVVDKLATIGLAASRTKKVINEITTSDAKGYWNNSFDKHPYLYNKRMYFNTTKAYNQPGIYFLGDHGKDDDLLGIKSSDGAYSIISLKEPEPILELVRTHVVNLADGFDTIAMVRLDKVFAQDTYNDINRFGVYAIEQPKADRLDLYTILDQEPLVRELRPPKLAMRAIESISDLYKVLTDYIEDNPRLIITDISDILYERTEKISKKKETTSTMKFRNEFNVGFSTLKVDVNYGLGEDLKKHNVTLTLGIDILDRNSLKRLEDKNPKVVVLTWLDSPDVFRTATVIQTGEDIGIWCGVYSNVWYVKNK